MLVTTGGWLLPLGATNVNALERVAVRPPDVTTTSAAPALVLAPSTAVNTVGLWSATLVATTPPMMTVASDEKFAPLIVRFVPPVVLP
jgi:hypothetical protein